MKTNKNCKFYLLIFAFICATLLVSSVSADATLTDLPTTSFTTVPTKSIGEISYPTTFPTISVIPTRIVPTSKKDIFITDIGNRAPKLISEVELKKIINAINLNESEMEEIVDTQSDMDDKIAIIVSSDFKSSVKLNMQTKTFGMTDELDSYVNKKDVAAPLKSFVPSRDDDGMIENDVPLDPVLEAQWDAYLTNFVNHYKSTGEFGEVIV